MLLFDFNICYLAGRAVLAGQSPYSIVGFISPYPLAVLFALIAWLPEPVAYGVYLAGCLALLWKVVGRRSIWALLSFPVLFNLFVGQMDLPLGLLGAWLGPWSLPLMLVKPQVGFVVLPWAVRHAHWRQLVWPCVVAAAFLALCFVLRPTWLAEWLAFVPAVTDYARHDSNLYWLVPNGLKTIALVVGILVALPVGFLLRERRDSWIALHLFAPLTNIYSASVLAEWIGPLEVILSWLAIFVVGTIHSGAPLFVVALSILLRRAVVDWRTRRRARQIAPPASTVG